MCRFKIVFKKVAIFLGTSCPVLKFETFYASEVFRVITDKYQIVGYGDGGDHQVHIGEDGTVLFQSCLLFGKYCG